MQQIADLWVIVFPDGLLPVIDDVYRQHQELMNNLEELAVPSEELMLNYYKSLSPLEVVYSNSLLLPCLLALMAGV